MTAPDRWGNAAATLAVALPVLPIIRAQGYPAALCFQDGLAELLMPWDAFDAVLVGGSNEWRQSAGCHRLLAEAKARGKWLHLGRVNSFQRLMGAMVAGYDSADGTFVGFGPSVRLPEVLRWLKQIDRQPMLDLLMQGSADGAS